MSLLPYPRGPAPHEMMQPLLAVFGTACPSSIVCSRHARLNLKAAVVPNPLWREVAVTHEIATQTLCLCFCPLTFPETCMHKNAQTYISFIAQESLHKPHGRYIIIICSPSIPMDSLTLQNAPILSTCIPAFNRRMRSSSGRGGGEVKSPETCL